VRLAPHALPDPFAVVLLVATVFALMCWRVGTLELMLGGSVLEVLRSRLPSFQVVRSMPWASTRI